MAEKVKLAVVGCGSMGGEQIRIDSPDSTGQDRRPCGHSSPSLSAEKLKDLLSSDPSIATYDSLDAMLKKSARPACAAIVIVTPHTLHFSQCMACTWIMATMC